MYVEEMTFMGVICPTLEMVFQLLQEQVTCQRSHRPGLGAGRGAGGTQIVEEAVRCEVGSVLSRMVLGSWFLDQV
jgi:hypothetical protein